VSFADGGSLLILRIRILRFLCCQANSRTLDPGLTRGANQDDVSFSLLRIRSDGKKYDMSFAEG